MLTDPIYRHLRHTNKSFQPAANSAGVRVPDSKGNLADWLSKKSCTYFKKKCELFSILCRESRFYTVALNITSLMYIISITEVLIIHSAASSAWPILPSTRSSWLLILIIVHRFGDAVAGTTIKPLSCRLNLSINFGCNGFLRHF